MDFDETRLYYSQQQLQRQIPTSGDGNQENARDQRGQDDGNDTVNLDAVRRHFREFLRNYRLGPQQYLYRGKLLRLHRRLCRNSQNVGSNVEHKSSTTESAMLEVNVAHLGEYDAALMGYVRDQPATILPTLELAASDALSTLLYDLKQSNNLSDDDENDEPNRASGNNDKASSSPDFDIQILLTGNLATTSLRTIKSDHLNRLLKCPAIVISASAVKCRATTLVVRCSRCNDTQTLQATDGPFGSIVLPSRCHGTNPGECGANPYSQVPDDSSFVDRQIIKLQEPPEQVPTGEMPRTVLTVVERTLVDRTPPGSRVSVFCIPSLMSKSQDGSTRSIYLRVVGLNKDSDHGDSAKFTPQEEKAFVQLSRRKDVYEILTRSIAPTISGAYTLDIKRALVCLLLGGTSKRQPDGCRLRGDVNVLLLGDPSTAKSQFLKFISKVAPIGIYTSGKGSSAAGLTASVVRDAKGEFYLEGGAMVLADGGVVCIDEFDKMRPADRVAIHEAMEQQTISVAKAGITTVLNSRSSVLAAANPVFGRYDDFKSASENIDLMTTILSRFDLIFLVRDHREEARDLMICRHVMGVHIGNSSSSRRSESGGDRAVAFLSSVHPQAGGSSNESVSTTPDAIAEHVQQVANSGIGELEVPAMKKFIQYCKAKCKPILSEEAGQVLTSAYVKIRDDVRKTSLQGGIEDAQAVIPITVRQLEALVRLSESLAKARLDSEVRIEDVNEALRLFRVSTMAASAAEQGENSILNAASNVNREDMDRTQGFLRSRLTIGSMVNKQKLVDEAAGQGYNAMMVARVLAVMAMRGEVLERNQGRLLKRIK